MIGSANIFINSLKISSLFFANALNGLIRLPINMVAPEASELLFGQQESNLLLNRHMNCENYFLKNPPTNATNKSPVDVLTTVEQKKLEVNPTPSTGIKLTPSGIILETAVEDDKLTQSFGP